MIDLEWLSDRLCDVLAWHLANPDCGDGPDAPEVPPAGERVWGIFLALNSSRTGGGHGPNPISHVEIEAWSRLYREPLRAFELDIVRQLDMAWMRAAAYRAENVGKPDDEVGPPMTPDLFRAVFKGERPKPKPDVNSRPFSLEVFDAVLGV